MIVFISLGFREVMGQLFLAVFALATLVQIAVWVGIFGRFVRAAQSTAAQSTAAPPPLIAAPSVSILVCARNEAANLQRFLPVLLTQAYTGAFEVLVADDASEDDSLLVLNDLQQKFPHLRVVRILQKTSSGKKYALQQAIDTAQFDLLLCTDADCQPAGPQWLTRMVETFLTKPETDIVLGYGPTLPRSGALGSWTAFETAYTALQYFAFAHSGRPYMGVGRNLLWKKSLFARTGGFSTHLHLASGDDDLLVNAAAHHANVALCLSPDAFVFSAGKTTWAAWLRQKHRHLTASSLYQQDHKILLTAVGMSHCIHFGLGAILWIAGVGVPWLGLGYVLRLTVVWPVYWIGFQQLGIQRLRWWAPVLDGFMAVYYGAVAPVLLLGAKRRVVWKA